METTVRDSVQKKYAQAAQIQDQNLCCPTGYNFSELKKFIPEEVLNVSYGCGTPAGLDHVKAGEVVLDIGSGGGIDCFQAASRVGPSGQVIGIDMTDEMLAMAKRNAPIVAKNLGFSRSNIEFRKGYAEEIPVEDASIDLVISNCVINLSVNKSKVFQEMFRVLKVQGRFTISDIVSDQNVPNYLRYDADQWGQCLSGALQIEEYLDAINQAGFVGVHQVKAFPWKTIDGIHFYSITLTGYKFKESKSSRCVFATFRGPFLRVVSELGTPFKRGRGTAISDRERLIISKTPLSQYFILSDTSLNVPPGHPEYLCVKPENQPCVWKGEFAILTSFFLSAQDDDEHIYKRGQSLEICSKTQKVLSSEHYQKFFSIISRASQNLSSQEVVCGDSAGCC